jgi:hypothetical protein
MAGHWNPRADLHELGFTRSSDCQGIECHHRGPLRALVFFNFIGDPYGFIVRVDRQVGDQKFSADATGSDALRQAIAGVENARNRKQIPEN